MLIRPAKPEDARAIAAFIAMAESEMVHHFAGTTDPVKAEEALMAFVLSPVPNRYSLENNLVAEIDGVTAGAMMSFPADKQPELDIPLLESLNKRGYGLDKLFFEGEPGTYYLSTMGVNPDFRGRGLGSAMLNGGCERGRQLGFDRASLLVSKGKEKAKALYVRLEFEVLSEVSIVDVDYYRMIKKL